ncbi:MAG: deoxyribose-phosphate aldolase [Lachnospiraceae bacterium]|nr:deoxyribose-phosphate aldolase [Lachnospiraceae bacterium]
MNIQEILSKVDHTLLSQTATWDEIKAICDDGIKYQTASVCIPSAYVKQAAEYVKGQVPICTVIGFPNGYVPTAIKCEEARLAITDGADEIDMVIWVGALKDKQYDAILEEIKAIKKVCGDKILKVIIETCLLTEEEKIKMCEIVMASGADFIKTSTGFSTAGATPDDIRIFAKHISAPVQIKAAGGIKSIADAEEFLALGAHRLGTSRIVKIVKEM